MQEKFKKIFQFELRGMVTPDYKMRLRPTNCANWLYHLWQWVHLYLVLKSRSMQSSVVEGSDWVEFKKKSMTFFD